MAQKKPLDEAHIHEGHRKRLLDTMINAGMENVSEIQAMEFILGYIFPRGDVNPLAHRLLAEFGSVANVLDADVNSLKDIKGMGERSAKSLFMLGELFHFYTHNKTGKKIKLTTYEEICDYFEESLRFRTVENFVIVALDAKMNLTHRKILAKGTVKNVGIPPLNVSNFIASSRAVYVIFAHNHPTGTARASEQDLKANAGFASLLACLGVNFVDHIIVGEDGIFSIKNNKFLREFC